MIVMAALGAALGATLFGLSWLLIPRRTSIPVQLARFDARQSAPSRPEPELGSFSRVRTHLGVRLTGWLASRGITYPHLRQDLAVTGGNLETLMGRKVLAFAGGFFSVVAAGVFLRTSLDVALPLASPALLAVGVGAGLFFAPDLQTHRQATVARRQFRRVLGSWLDLVALEMAGSAAPAEALPSAARIGSSWPMLVLSDTLYRATTAGQDHWDALTDLGHRIGVSELIDLAALTRLVGRDGARVRDTLTARAASMRRALLADAESHAGRQDQSMILAQILIGLAFIVFLMYPALANVLDTRQ